MRADLLRLRGAKAGLLLGLSAALLAGCDTGNPQSTLNPQGPNAQLIFDLFHLAVFWPAVLVFVVVEAVLVYAIWRYRGRPGDPLPNQYHGNTTLEITWTIIPALILVVILFFTFRTQAVLATPQDSSRAINVRVIGHQWWWEFEYPDYGFVTANELHVPVGVPINLTLESIDVIHSFWTPFLAGKQDAIPGRVNRMWMQADKEGTYHGQCAEFCGVEHALMRFLVFAESPSQFESWARDQRSIPSFAVQPTPAAGAGAPTGAQSLVQQGGQLFANGACITCHTVRGTPANGKVGPDLTHFGGRTSLAGNTLEKGPNGEGIKRWLRNPQAVKPGNLMPNLNLSDSDIEALAAYLQSLK
jgi:cytochrome c oxidase subunit II